MSDPTSSELREQALNIREAAMGFSSETSRTLIELAEAMEAKAAAMQIAETKRD